jgi:hypothetical protein
MNAGWHYLPGGEDDPFAPLPASTFLDLAPTMGMRSPERLVRPYFKGVPAFEKVVADVLAWTAKGCRVQIANEPNLPQEGWSGGVENLCMLFEQLAHDPRIWPDPYPRTARLYWPGMSPGVPGWEEWYVGPWASDGINAADGIAVHCYGTLDEMKRPIEVILDQLPGARLWVAECNFGAGQQVDKARWADEHFRPFLDWCSSIPQIEAVTYFAYKWVDPDMPTPTPVDGAGTRIETVLRAWTPPSTPPIVEPTPGEENDEFEHTDEENDVDEAKQREAAHYEANVWGPLWRVADLLEQTAYHSDGATAQAIKNIIVLSKVAHGVEDA